MTVLHPINLPALPDRAQREDLAAREYAARVRAIAQTIEDRAGGSLDFDPAEAHAIAVEALARATLAAGKTRVEWEKEVGLRNV